MAKGLLAAPLYVAVAWTLLISYQSFTKVAVQSVVQQLQIHLPDAAAWLTPHIDEVVFIHAFAWIFLATSAIPSLLLRRTQSMLLQFLLVLALSFTGLYLAGIVAQALGREVTQDILGLSVWLENPVLAALYLLAPYLGMLTIDLYTLRRTLRHKEKSGEQDKPRKPVDHRTSP